MILQVNGLTKRFGGFPALSGFHLDIKEGELTAIIGPNGAGKTTLFDILCGLLRPDSGHVTFQGRSITHTPTYQIAQLGLARTFQIIRLFPELSVMDNLLLASENGIRQNLKRSFISSNEGVNEARAFEWLEWVELEAHVNELAKNLSHGQQKLIEIVRAVLTNARMLLLDEPVSGIFPEMRSNLSSIIKTLVNDEGRTILFVEHDIDFVLSTAKRVVVMDQGRNIFDGGPDQLEESVVFQRLFFRKATAS